MSRQAHPRPRKRPVRRLLPWLPWGIEWLEIRAVPAVITPFAPRFQANENGDIVFAANTILTAPASDPAATDAQNGIGSLINNNDFAMDYVDVDSDVTTFDSSTARLSLPANSQVLFAGLYWGASSSSAQRVDVKLMAPGGGSYTPITGALIGADGNNNYQAFADVTALVQAAGAGNYTVANVQAATGTGKQGGWGLVVAYRDPLAHPRNLTVFDGLALVNNASPNVSFSINGFQAPPSGTVNANIGVLTYEGDAGLTGDSMALDGTVLTDALNPSTNFFNSTISRNGTRVGTKNPDYTNQLGFDADFVAANGVILNNANSATIALTTGGETYLPGVVTTSIDLYAPILRIPKIVNNLTHPSGPTRPGDVLEYTLVVENIGGEVAQAIVLDDAVPASTTYVPGSLEATFGQGTLGSLTDVSGDDAADFDAVTHHVVFRVGAGADGATGGTLAIGQYETIRFRVQVDPGTPADTQVVNQANLTYSGATTGTSMATSSTALSLVVQELSDLGVTVSSDLPAPAPGDTINLTVTLHNAGPSDATGVAVTDLLPGALSFLWATPGQGTYDSASGVWTVGGLSAGGTTTLVIQATVNAATFTDTAAVTASGTRDPNPVNDHDTLAAAAQATDLGITVGVDNPTPALGDTVTFTVTLTNNGPAGATGVVVQNPIPPGVDLIATTPSAGSFDPLTGLWSLGALNSGQAVTLQIVARVVQPDTVRDVAAIWTADQPDPTPGNDQASATTLTQRADLGVVASVDQPTPDVGDLVNFTFTVSNVGPFPAAGVHLDAILPAGLLFVNANPSQGTYDNLTGIWSVGTLDTMASRTLTVTALVSSASSATFSGIVGAPEQVDPAAANNLAAATVIPLQSDLGLSASVDQPTPNVGDPVAVTITVQNAGPDATGAVIHSPLPAGLTFVTAVPSVGSYDALTGDWTIPTLASGGSATLTLNATVASPAGATVTASVSQADHHDGNPANNSAQVSVSPRQSDLGLTLGVDQPAPNVGDLVTFTVGLSNLGPDAATGVTASLPLPAGLAFSTATPSQGTYDSVTGAWNLGSLGPASAGSLRVTATVTTPAAQVVTASISHSDQYDGTSPNNSAQVVVTPLQADLGLSLTIDQPSPNVGDTVTLTATLANCGPDAATSVTVSALLPPGLTWVSTSAGQGTYNPATGIWTVGTLASGSSTTLVLQVTVASSSPSSVTASVSHADQYDATAVNNSASVSESSQQADLALALATSASTPNVGDTVSLTLTLTNAGPDPATNVAIAEPLPAGLTFVSATPGQGTYNPATGIWTVGTLAGSGATTLLIQATVASPAASTVTAALSHSDQFDPSTGDHTSAVTLTPRQSDLSLNVAIDNPTPNVGDTVTLTATLANSGPDAANHVTVTALLPAGLSFLSATPAQGTYDPASGFWQVNSVAANSSTTLVVRGTVTAAAPISVPVMVTHADEYDATAANNSASLTITPRQADVGLSLAIDESQPYAGDTVTLTLTAHNAGPDPAQAVIVHDLLPAGMSLTTATPSQGTFNPVTGDWTLGDLPSAGAATLTLVARVDTAAVKTDTATVGTPVVHDPNTANDTASLTITPRHADVVVSQSLSNPTPNVGDLVTFTIVVQNHGPDAAPAVVVVDQLPAGLEYASAHVDTGALYDPVTGQWAVGTMANGATATLTIQARLTSAEAGQNTVSLAGDSSNGTDPNTNNNQDSSGFTPQKADLAVTTSSDHVDAGPGDIVTYTVTLTNQSATGTATNVLLAAPLPDGTVLDSVDPSQGTYDPATGRWTVGSLGGSASVTLTLHARVVNAVGAFTAAVSSADQYDPTRGNNQAGVDALALVQTALSGRVYVDLNHDGHFELSEYGLATITVTLRGTDDLGQAVTRSTLTAADGQFQFDGLRPGTYTLDAAAPKTFRKGSPHAGTAGGTVTAQNGLRVTLPAGPATGYELALLAAPDCRLVPVANEVRAVLADLIHRRSVNAARFDHYHPYAGTALAQGILPARLVRLASGPFLSRYVPTLADFPADLAGLPGVGPMLRPARVARLRGR